MKSCVCFLMLTVLLSTVSSAPYSGGIKGQRKFNKDLFLDPRDQQRQFERSTTVPIPDELLQQYAPDENDKQISQTNIQEEESHITEAVEEPRPILVIESHSIDEDVQTHVQEEQGHDMKHFTTQSIPDFSQSYIHKTKDNDQEPIQNDRKVTDTITDYSIPQGLFKDDQINTDKNGQQKTDHVDQQRNEDSDYQKMNQDDVQRTDQVTDHSFSQETYKNEEKKYKYDQNKHDQDDHGISKVLYEDDQKKSEQNDQQRTNHKDQHTYGENDHNKNDQDHQKAGEENHQKSDLNNEKIDSKSNDYQSHQIVTAIPESEEDDGQTQEHQKPEDTYLLQVPQIIASDYFNMEDDHQEQKLVTMTDYAFQEPEDDQQHASRGDQSGLQTSYDVLPGMLPKENSDQDQQSHDTSYNVPPSDEDTDSPSEKDISRFLQPPSGDQHDNFSSSSSPAPATSQTKIPIKTVKGRHTFDWLKIAQQYVFGTSR